jgi:tRNA pseudouridine38-40 synthase
MARYFIEVSYKGSNYSGFQVQKNANSIQAEIEKALRLFFKEPFTLTGSSRTDAGVHALQNYFHFDSDIPIAEKKGFVYNLNSILPLDIVIKKIFQVDNNAHCRFDAISREYKYYIFRNKNPFLQDRAFYYPYKIDIDKLNEASKLLMTYKDFTSFSKRNTQVKDFICNIKKSEWIEENATLIYNVEANRFLRGMVKGLVGTMLRVGTGKLILNQFEEIIKARDCTKADFSVDSKGLFLVSVNF